MHEWTFAQNILQTALGEAERHTAKRINLLRVKLAEAEHIEPSSLRFCFEALSKGTIAEGANLEVEIVNGRESFLETIELEQDPDC